MNRIEHLLFQVSEECNEIGQRASKAARFGLEQVQQARDDAPWQNPDKLNNGERIVAEFYDLCATLALLGLFTPDMFDLQAYIDAVQQKHAKIEKYLELARNSGTLTCEWPECDQPTLCRSGNFGNRLVCEGHFKVTNGTPWPQP